MMTAEVDMLDVFAEIFNTRSSNDKEQKIGYVLKQLGIAANLKGYKYLKDAIILTMEDPESVELITKVLYPTVAKKNHATSSRVERAIRHAVRSVEGADEFKKTIFLGLPKDHYTNKEFIMGIAEYLGYGE